MGVSIVSKRRNGHTKPRSINGLDLSKPCLVFLGHMLTYSGGGSTRLYRLIDKGEVPPPAGKLGKFNYWHSETVRAWLHGEWKPQTA